MERPLLRIAGLDKVYANGTIALRGFDLDVPQRAFLSLLGPSGCGKSTALRIIAGLGEHSVGSIDWPLAAHDAAGRPKRNIGFVFQEPNLMPWASVFDNVWLPLRLAGMDRATAAPKVRAVLEMVRLAGFETAIPRELSGGMRMRVSVARALVTEPRLLLMDEPFAALDEITRSQLSQDLLAIWRQTGCTVLFVTHSVYESVHLSQRILVMAARPGRVIGEVTIPEPYPRDAAFRLTPEYARSCGAVSALLAQAMDTPAL